MTENEIKQQWQNEKHAYSALGEFVIHTVMSSLGHQGLDCSTFFKIQPNFRLKDTSSLIEKAFYRNKPYTDPYTEITDKVGVRFVVLLTSDIETVKQSIQNSKRWVASLDKDYEAERENKPEVFTYESVHFVISTNEPCNYSGVTIPENSKCEIQIRTILQHAYSELTHDSIYKTKNKVNAKAIRSCAKAMALIEAADELFITARKEIEMANMPEKDMVDFLLKVYRDRIGHEPVETRLTSMLIEALLAIEIEGLKSNIIDYYDKKPYLSRLIKDKSIHEHLYSDPAILLVLYLLDVATTQVVRAWPLTSKELEQPALDVGVNIYD